MNIVKIFIKRGSPLLFIYIVSAYLPCLIDTVREEFNNSVENCSFTEVPEVNLLCSDKKFTQSTSNQ